MKFVQKKLIETNYSSSNLKKSDSLGFELIVKDLDIEKKMTEFTFKQVMS